MTPQRETNKYLFLQKNISGSSAAVITRPDTTTEGTNINGVSFESKSVHGVGQLVFHLEWCPKYRYNMLRQERFKDFLATILEEESTKLRCRIIEMGIEDDHVHLVIATRQSISISELLQHLKGKSSYKLFRYEPKFRLRYPKGSFWSPEKFYRSVGDVDLETVRNYVRKQDHRQRTLAM